MIVGMCALVDIFSIGGLAYYANKGSSEPTWLKFATVSCGIAVLAGIGFGYYNYHWNLIHFYQMQDLKAYPAVDASVEHGQNLMDAGRLYFAHGNKLDITRGWHFKHGTIYCVAPVIGGQGLPETGSYDFWAVGKDCCVESSSDFRCGDWDKPHARGGLRLMELRDRPFYELAVEQAKTNYKLIADHPIFFEWFEEPLHRVNEWRDTGLNYWLLACFGHFSFCVVCAGLATYNFAFMGRGPQKK